MIFHFKIRFPWTNIGKKLFLWPNMNKNCWITDYLYTLYSTCHWKIFFSAHHWLFSENTYHWISIHLSQNINCILRLLYIYHWLFIYLSLKICIPIFMYLSLNIYLPIAEFPVAHDSPSSSFSLKVFVGVQLKERKTCILTVKNNSE